MSRVDSKQNPAILNLMLFNIIQIIISLLLIAAVLLQQRGVGGLGAAFGGGESGAYRTKRGFEKKLFISTIVLAALFICIAFARLLIH